MQGKISMSGSLATRVIRAPGPGLLWKMSNLPNIWPGLWRAKVRRICRMSGFEGRLYAKLLRADGSVINYGLVSTRVVTTAFVNYMVDELIAETSAWGDFKFHDSGIGVTGAAVGDTDIETTDQESRATGTQVENAANIYESVGTISYTNTLAITEHGLFSTAANPTLMDRHTFSAINVVSGDSIQFTYDLTVSAGG